MSLHERGDKWTREREREWAAIRGVRSKEQMQMNHTKVNRTRPSDWVQRINAICPLSKYNDLCMLLTLCVCDLGYPEHSHLPCVCFSGVIRIALVRWTQHNLHSWKNQLGKCKVNLLNPSLIEWLQSLTNNELCLSLSLSLSYEWVVSFFLSLSASVSQFTLYLWPEGKQSLLDQGELGSAEERAMHFTPREQETGVQAWTQVHLTES